MTSAVHYAIASLLAFVVVESLETDINQRE